jgi:hypothetical protein
MTATDAEVLDDLLDGRAGAELPERLLQLATIAAELAGALASPSLSRADRHRLLVRAQALSRRRTHLFGVVPRPHRPSAPLVAAGAGGAAVTLAVIGVALLRRSAQHPAAPLPVVRPAA